MNQYRSARNAAGGGVQAGMRFGAHEFLETQEALRSKTAEIEFFGMLMSQARDPHLRDIMSSQQRRMMQAYETLMGLMMNQGMQQQVQQMQQQMSMNNQMRIGLHDPQMPAPNPRAVMMSDFSIATIALNWHKMGSVAAMYWANECVQPQLRMYYVNAANSCQQMAYECFQFMNANGLYQVPQLEDHTMQTMMEAFQNQGGAQGMQGAPGIYGAQSIQIDMQGMQRAQSFQGQLGSLEMSRRQNQGGLSH